jgi:asparagine N-glycosylation enzyme membrane subunit Stt3
MSTPKADARSFARWVALITAVGLVGRVAYVLFVTRHYTVWGDAYFYHESSNLIADGKGFINPIDWIENHVRIQAADHPPLYLIYLAGWSLIGVTSTTGHMLVSVLLGAATIAVTAYAGREIAGPRVGLIAAALVAIYPNVWAPDGMLLSETMAILTVSLTMLLV